MIELSPHERVQLYAKSRNIQIDFAAALGSGTDGKVWKSDRASAVKVFEREKSYWVEYDCYERFQEYGLTRLDRFDLPELIDHDDSLFVLEITIVAPPFILRLCESADRPTSGFFRRSASRP